MEIQYMKELEWAKLILMPPNKRNQIRYCHFHKDHGHDTEECLHLKEKIEGLLKWGLLTKYAKMIEAKQK